NAYADRVLAEGITADRRAVSGADDRIRHGRVSGVRTCALPISGGGVSASDVDHAIPEPTAVAQHHVTDRACRRAAHKVYRTPVRSEERRVGKECRDRWAPDRHKKKDKTCRDKKAGHR